VWIMLNVLDAHILLSTAQNDFNIERPRHCYYHCEIGLMILLRYRQAASVVSPLPIITSSAMLSYLTFVTRYAGHLHQRSSDRNSMFSLIVYHGLLHLATPACMPLGLPCAIFCPGLWTPPADMPGTLPELPNLWICGVALRLGGRFALGNPCMFIEGI